MRAGAGRPPLEWMQRCERAAMCLWFVVTNPPDVPIDKALMRDLWLAEQPETRDRWTSVIMMISNID